MIKFKTGLNIIAVAIIAVSLANCKGKEKEENVEDLEVETQIPETETAEMTDAEYQNAEMTESETSGSEDYDKMLDDYDQYVTEYVQFYKKAMKGDQSALAEYPAMMQKATNLQESMQKAQGDKQLSVEQITRMSKIQNKMLQAMQ
jgi:hypothetical protein